MKRMVMAVIISAMMYAATAAMLTSCTWMENIFETEKPKDDGPVIPADEVLDVRELIAGDFDGDTVWVRGIVVGGLLSDGALDFALGSEVMGNVLVLADEADCHDPDDCMALQLTKKAHKEELGPDRDANREKVFHQELYVQGKATTYKRMPALTNICTYQLE